MDFFDMNELFDSFIDTVFDELKNYKEAEEIRKKKEAAIKRGEAVKKKAEEAKATSKKIKKTKLSPPWYTLANKINAFFKGDEDVTVFPLAKIEKTDSETKEEYVIYIDTPDADKAIALQKVLKTEYPFGNINVKVVIRVTNSTDKKAKVNTKVSTEPATYNDYCDAFISTPNVEDIQLVRDVFGTQWTVVIFKKEVVQFYNDDLTDAFGNWNGLYTDIANDIFKYNDHIKYGIAEK